MILLLDIGNSRIKWGTLHSGKVAGHGAVPYTAAGLAQALSEMLDGQPRPDAVWISNVAGAAAGAAATAACSSLWGLSARFAAPGLQALGIRNAYREPATLGVDRWLAMLAAHAHPGGRVCVVNCGTAVTVDIVDAAGMHLGGLIVPGVELMIQSLSEATDAVSINPTGSPADAFGRSTQECVMNGTHAAVAALIERTLERLAAESGEQPRCVISGGGAPAVIPLLRSAVLHDPDLVLRGLALLAGRE
jgi:type III pantothenate kinase